MGTIKEARIQEVEVLDSSTDTQYIMYQTTVPEAIIGIDDYIDNKLKDLFIFKNIPIAISNVDNEIIYVSGIESYQLISIVSDNISVTINGICKVDDSYAVYVKKCTDAEIHNINIICTYIKCNN